MNPEVFTQFASPDPNASPLNLVQLVDLLNQLVSSQIQGSYLPYVMQSTQPGVDDQDKAWIELDTGGKPKSIKIWYVGSSGGNWRRIYNGMLGEVRGFSGDPGYSSTGNFDTHGRGNIGKDYDGWHICNGQDGVIDLSNQFICAANLNTNGSATGYNTATGKWETIIHIPPAPDIVAPGGGLWTTMLKPENIPLPAKDRTAGVDKYTADGNARATNGDLYGVPDASSDVYLVPADPGFSDTTAIFTAPPFYTLAWITFVGYQ